MSADYLPVFDPDIHGHAYAAKHPGQDTRPFAAVRPYVQPATPPQCRCDAHKYGRNPGTDAVLYAGPDAVMLMVNAAIRDGRYDDIGADIDARQHSIHADFDAVGRRFGRKLAPVWQQIAAASKQAAA